MNIQSSLNSAFSMATFLFSQTPKAQEVKEERARQAEIERLKANAERATEAWATADDPRADDPDYEAKREIYMSSLSANTKAQRALFEADPTTANYRNYVDSLGFDKTERAEDEWIDNAVREDQEIESQRKAEKAEQERMEAERREQERLKSDAIRRKILRGGLDD